MDETRLAACPRCGRPLAADAPEGLCPACILEGAVGDQTALSGADGVTVLTAPSSEAAPGAPTGDAPRLETGQPFGPYRIGRQLGRGGMGEVYEAEHVDSGRRVALKILRRRLAHAEDRARFLREGQLAASVSHPHTVYIFGSEDIGGTPVISMELLPGGTLKDRVVAEGPLPFPEAVRSVLDILGGLDAAQAAGILHRDIKPSNCFADGDGTIKVGDFGLSISTLARDVRDPAGPPMFQGTPQFAPPEQLRGEALDVRADIYAVGATLYYLLTGRAPFQADDLRELFRMVTETPPPSPRVYRRDLPKGLAAVVLQCLEKDPAARPASHAALAEQLRPWSYASYVPAPPGLRAVAGLVDMFLLSIPGSVTEGWTATVVEGSVQRSSNLNITTTLVAIAYYLLLEGVWGASVGKRLFGLRVTGATGPSSFGAVVRRTGIFLIASLIVLAAVGLFGGDAVARFIAEHPAMALLMAFGSIGLTAALFLTMRRANGYAAVHDLLSGTRVVRPRQRLQRTVAHGAAGLDAEAPREERRLRCGPFEIIRELGGDRDGRLLEGFDPTLRRRLWIRAVPTGTPRISDARRDVGRVGRLHWLAGRRTANENWDAFEAPDGAPLSARLASRPGWHTVKVWLLDLARELVASERQDEVPRLSLDRVWIRGDGHAVLLDFPPPGAGDVGAENLSPVALLAAVADAALPGNADLPLSAREMLQRWSRLSHSSQGPPAAAALETLARVIESPDQVSRWRRSLPIAMAAIPVAVLSVGSIVALRWFDHATTPEMWEVYTLLDEVDEPAPPDAGPEDLALRQAAEVYLAGAYRDTLADETFWNGPVMSGDVSRLRPVSQRILAAHPDVTTSDLNAARLAVVSTLARARDEYDSGKGAELTGARALIAVVLATLGLGAATLGALASALLAPGGVILRLLGFAVVTRNGREIGRLRSLFRAVVAWLPALAFFVWLGPSPIDQAMSSAVLPELVGAFVMLVLGAGAAWTLIEPERGPVGRLTATRVVVR